MVLSAIQKVKEAGANFRKIGRKRADGAEFSQEQENGHIPEPAKAGE